MSVGFQSLQLFKFESLFIGYNIWIYLAEKRITGNKE